MRLRQGARQDAGPNRRRRPFQAKNSLEAAAREELQSSLAARERLATGSEERAIREARDKVGTLRDAWQWLQANSWRKRASTLSGLRERDGEGVVIAYYTQTSAGGVPDEAHH